MPRIFKKISPKRTILGSSIVLLVISSLSVGLTKTLPQITLSVVTAVFVDLAINYFKKTRYFFPEAGLITGIICALVLPISTNPIVVAITVVIAVASKQFLKIKNNHIFNPAAFGIVVGSWIFGYPLGWWADTILWLTIILGAIVTIRIRKEFQLSGFLLMYFLIQLILNPVFALPYELPLFLGLKIGQLLFLSLTNALGFSFFLLFMLPEPMTSTTSYKLSFIFGVSVALLSFLFALIPVPAISRVSILLGLLTTNLLVALFRLLGTLARQEFRNPAKAISDQG